MGTDSGEFAGATVSFAALGTTATVIVTPSDQNVLEAARAAAAAEAMAMDRAASRFRSDSELSGVNRCRGQDVASSELLMEAVEAALRGARLSGGLVDPTIGTAIRLLGYDRDFAAVDPDGPPLQLAARPVPGWRLVTVDRDRGTIRVPDGVELDLGSTAKALAVDRAARSAWLATGAGADAGVLVSLGGDIAVAGTPPLGGWPIRVTDDHASPIDAPGQTVSIRTGGLATSSTTVRRWQRGDIVLHHIVDPRTGRPAAPWWRTATVTAASCVDANIAATAAIILGPDAPAWLERLHLPARLVRVEGSVLVVGDWPTGD
ncbi:MAG TPA: FAD:protein FMN transferase [Acidimicrobiales bacterium]|jgi:thiamine biosynthesis lipoprotein